MSYLVLMLSASSTFNVAKEYMDIEWAHANPDKSLKELTDYHNVEYQLDDFLLFEHDLFHCIVGLSGCIAPTPHQGTDTAEVIVDSMEDVLVHAYQQNLKKSDKKELSNYMFNHLSKVSFHDRMVDVNIAQTIETLMPYLFFIMDHVEKHDTGQERTSRNLSAIINLLQTEPIQTFLTLSAETKPVARAMPCPISERMRYRYV